MADMQPNCDNDQLNIMVLKIYLISIVLHTFNIDDSNAYIIFKYAFVFCCYILMHRFGYETYCCYTNLIVVMIVVNQI